MSPKFDIGQPEVSGFFGLYVPLCAGWFLLLLFLLWLGSRTQEKPLLSHWFSQKECERRGDQRENRLLFGGWLSTVFWLLAPVALGVRVTGSFLLKYYSLLSLRLGLSSIRNDESVFRRDQCDKRSYQVDKDGTSNQGDKGKSGDQDDCEC